MSREIKVVRRNSEDVNTNSTINVERDSNNEYSATPNTDSTVSTENTESTFFSTTAVSSSSHPHSFFGKTNTGLISGTLTLFIFFILVCKVIKSAKKKKLKEDLKEAQMLYKNQQVEAEKQRSNVERENLRLERQLLQQEREIQNLKRMITKQTTKTK